MFAKLNQCVENFSFFNSNVFWYLFYILKLNIWCEIVLTVLWSYAFYLSNEFQPFFFFPRIQPK